MTSSRGSPNARGAAAGSGTGAASPSAKRMSAGSSRYTGPRGGASAWRNAIATYSGIRSTAGHTAAHFVIGFIRESWSNSCSAPHSAWASGRAPPSTTSGVCAARQFATAVTVPVTPGPAVTSATPAARRTLPHASAAWAADCSCRTSTTRTPSCRQPS